MQPLAGKIYFIGAGPGDPSLLTIKAAKVLAKADVVITDRLVSEEILTEYVNPSAEIIPVGKQGNSSASTSQKEINELLIFYASRYKNVVRLKGGDVSLFSNVLDELKTVTEAGIAYEIIPGITAISGASAYTGIPLTAREFSTGVRILTYYQHKAIEEGLWKEMAQFNETLVFYMSGKSVLEVVNKLLQAGADENIPFVVVEQATTPNQFVHEYTLGNFLVMDDEADFISPALVIMGKVTSLYQQFSWLPNGERTSYFTNLEELAKSIAINNGYQNLSHVSRA
ncbi:MAG: uroporphyrinogen-III C-methyltransferase [Ilyomonas sp.]